MFTSCVRSFQCEMVHEPWDELSATSSFVFTCRMEIVGPTFIFSSILSNLETVMFGLFPLIIMVITARVGWEISCWMSHRQWMSGLLHMRIVCAKSCLPMVRGHQQHIITNAVLVTLPFAVQQPEKYCLLVCCRMSHHQIGKNSS